MQRARVPGARHRALLRFVGVAFLPCLLSMHGCATLQRLGSPEPVSPRNLRVDCASALVVGVRWQAADDTQKLVYQVSRDDQILGFTRETYFPDTTVAASSRYSYVVTATDAAGRAAASAPLWVDTPAAASQAEAPYCASPVISSMVWHWESGYNEANGSDLWPVTWGADNAVYTFFGDGGGFGGDNRRGRASFGISKISAPPPLSPATATNIYGGWNATHPAAVQGKASAILAVGTDFYTIGGIYTQPELARLGGGSHVSGSPQHVEIGYSRGNAYSWRASSWTFCAEDRNGPAGGFCPIGFINFGPGNRGAPGGYVYVLGFANSPSYWTGGDSAPARTFLARVAPTRILSRSAYRYFAGIDARGNPIWSANDERMQPIFSDRNPARPGCSGSCNMTGALTEAVYNTALRRYIGTAQGDSIGQTAFYDAPEPWGPWTVISYNNIDPASGSGGWGNLGATGSTLGAHPVNAWTSDDGLGMWVIYSSDSKAPPGSRFPPEGTLLDSFNLVKVDLQLNVPSYGLTSGQP